MRRAGIQQLCCSIPVNKELALGVNLFAAFHVRKRIAVRQSFLRRCFEELPSPANGSVNGCGGVTALFRFSAVGGFNGLLYGFHPLAESCSVVGGDLCYRLIRSKELD